MKGCKIQSMSYIGNSKEERLVETLLGDFMMLRFLLMQPNSLVLLLYVNIVVNLTPYLKPFSMYDLRIPYMKKEVDETEKEIDEHKKEWA